jgi:hypothetical protein
MPRGAGRGYWAEQLSLGGVNVAAYDFEPPDKAENASFHELWGSLMLSGITWMTWRSSRPTT